MKKPFTSKSSAERHEEYDTKGRSSPINLSVNKNKEKVMHTKEDEKESVEQNLVWSPHRIDKINIRLKALQIAADVFAQISDVCTIVPEVSESGESEQIHTPRTLKDFRESVDAVFKAAGLEKG